MDFHKVHGAGNDFILVDNMQFNYTLSAATVARLCARRFGVGADGLILAEPSTKADVFMNYYNADGTTAEICGNGLRALVKFCVDAGIAWGKDIAKVETRAGVVSVKVLANQGDVAVVSVDMGEANFKAAEIPVYSKKPEVIGEVISVDGIDYRYGCASMGNPHMVVLVDDLTAVPTLQIGPQLEQDTMFPSGANINFVQVLSPNEVRLKTWERGAGETLACGSGTCATVAVLGRMGLVGTEVTAHNPGGDLEISINHGRLTMTGEAVHAFFGSVDIK